jgi:hypothetical protein
MKRIIVILATAVLVACGSHSNLEGAYTSNDGKSTLTFSGDKVTTKDMKGNVIETTYHVDGKTLTFQFPNGLPNSFTINDNGSLSAPDSSGYKKN